MRRPPARARIARELRTSAPRSISAQARVFAPPLTRFNLGELSANVPRVKYVLNGESLETPDPLRVLDLLDRFDLRKQRVAVAVNAEVVPKSRFAEVWIRDGDKVEVIHAVGGGA